MRDTCFVLAWCLHGSCLGFACYLICIWWHSFRETHVCVCLYVYLLLPKFIKMCPKLFKRPPRSEWSERSTFVWFTYYVLITYFLLTYYLHNTHFFTYLSLTYYLALTHTYQDVSKVAPEMRPRSERSERSTFILRTYYVLITYLLLSLLLARDVRGTCFALAWCLHGSCVALSTHFCVCLYVCHVFFHVSARVFEFPLDRASRSFVSQVSTLRTI